MIETSVPKCAKRDANSQPMIPPPSTTSRRGSVVCASSPVESTQRGESRPGIGGVIGKAPVATIAERNVTSSCPSTASVFGPVNVPLPFSHSTPFAFSSPATPFVIWSTTPSFHVATVPKSSMRVGGDHAELRERLARLVEGVRALHPRLRGDATHAEARATEPRLALDTDDAAPELGGADRGGVPRGAASEDGDVTFHHCSPFVDFAGAMVAARPCDPRQASGARMVSESPTSATGRNPCCS